MAVALRMKRYDDERLVETVKAQAIENANAIGTMLFGKDKGAQPKEAQGEVW